MLHGKTSHIQSSGVKLGVKPTQVVPRGGANDLGGPLMEETICRMAGSENGSAKAVEELIAIAEGVGPPARQLQRPHPSGPKTEETNQRKREG
jgi:FO synthase